MKYACERCEKVLSRVKAEGNVIEFGGISGYLCKECFDGLLSWLDSGELQDDTGTKRKPKSVQGCLAFSDGRCLALKSKPVLCGGVIGVACEVEPEKREAFEIE